MTPFIWDVDPTLLHLGPLQIRYYGLFFACVMLFGFHFWKRTMLRLGYPEEKIYPYFYWMTFLGVLGARLGHCFFYEPNIFLRHPLEILMIWKGGLASHGGTLGLIIGTYVVHRVNRIPWLVVMDNTAFAAALAAFFVRVGNFFNSEILGRQTDAPWAFAFPRVERDGAIIARHPTQLYEAGIGLFVFSIIYLVDRRLGNRRPRGLLGGLFLVLYFPLRFFVEFFKTEQADPSILAPKDFVDFTGPWTMGQFLSFPFFMGGVFMLYLAWRERGRLTGAMPPDGYVPDPADAPAKKAVKRGKERRRK